MSFPFNPVQGLILVDTEIGGPTGLGTLRLALDLGATHTVLSESRLRRLGYDPSQATKHGRLTTASGVLIVPRLPVVRLNALGQDRFNFLVTVLNLPPTATVDGLLGLDFFRGQTLTIDFRAGLIDLT